MGKIKLNNLIALLILTVLLSSCSKNRPERYETAKVKRGSILASITSTGIVTPRNRLEIKPPVAGRIEDVLVNEGQTVFKGQILAWMSSSERATLLDAARFKGQNEYRYWQNVFKPTPIIAPLNGFIILRNTEPGQTVIGSDAVLVMADTLIIKAQVDETDIGQIKLRNEVEIVLDSYPDKSIKGYVEHISYESKVINNVTIYEVDILPRDMPVFFRSGMSTTVKFLQDKKDNILFLPSNAIRKKNERSFVFIKEKDNKNIELSQVETGLEGDNHIEVISGLNEDDEVIIPSAKMVQEIMERSRERRFFNPFSKKNKK